MTSEAVHLLKQRYGQESVHATQSLTPALETLLNHRSVRAFTRAALPAGTLELLVAAAQSAPSSSNLQVWSVIAVRDQARRERLAKLCGNQAHIAEAPLFLAWLVDLSRASRIAEQLNQPAEGIAYLDTFLMGVIDASLAAQNALVAAEALGLGGVYIGALRNRPEEVAAELNVGPGAFAVFGMSIGVPDGARPTAIKPRLPQRAVLHLEQHSHAAQDQHVAAYDGVMRGFYESQGQPVASWSEHSAERLRTAEGLRGRHRLKEALEKLGFALR